MIEIKIKKASPKFLTFDKPGIYKVTLTGDKFPLFRTHYVDKLKKYKPKCPVCTCTMEK